MLHGKIIKEAYTFDDVLLVPSFSEVLPHEVSLQTKLTRNIHLNIPIISAAMDTVTESGMSIALALEGGIGIIHKNLSIQEQSQKVSKVKNFPFDKKLFPHAVTDKEGRLLVGAALGVSADLLERAEALAKAGVDVFTLDSAHGHSKGIIEALKELKRKFPHIDVIAGNIVTAEAAQTLVYAGADAVKIGVGPGAICTTRVVAGVGVPQLTAINDVYEQLINQDVGIIADGGIKFSGDIAKAIAAGAHSVMLGRMLAGTDEAPGEMIEKDGKKFKSYVGMGSMAAMKRGSKDRYFQEKQSQNKLVPEGIEALVNYKGAVKNILYQLTGGLKAGMGYCGAKDIESMRHHARFVKISNAGLTESHPHDVMIAKSAPNYEK
jgi:IMP dehydrogenase